MAKAKFQMNGKVYGTMMSIARDLGKKRVYREDFPKYGIVEVSLDGEDIMTETINTAANTQTTLEMTEEITDTDGTDTGVTTTQIEIVDTPEETDTDGTDTGVTTTQIEIADTPEETDTDGTTTDGTTTDGTTTDGTTTDGTTTQMADLAEVPTHTESDTAQITDEEATRIAKLEEDVVDMTVTQFRNALRAFTIDGLVTMVSKVGGKQWEHIAHKGIRKMRLIMELKEAYYPGEKIEWTPSPWSTIPTEKLEKALEENHLTYAKCENKGINRMRMIVALKTAAIDPNEVK